MSSTIKECIDAVVTAEVVDGTTTESVLLELVGPRTTQVVQRVLDRGTAVGLMHDLAAVLGYEIVGD